MVHFERKLGKLTDDMMNKIKRALAFALDLESATH